MARKFFNVQTVNNVTFYQDDVTLGTLAVVSESGDAWFTTFAPQVLNRDEGQTISPIPTREDAEKIARIVLWAYGYTLVNPGENVLFADNA